MALVTAASRGWRRLAAGGALALALVVTGPLAWAEQRGPHDGEPAASPAPPAASAGTSRAAESRPDAAGSHGEGVSSSVGWTVIVHPANPVRRLKATELERIYRRRQRFWPDGGAILALNLPSGDPLRSAFTEAVLHDSEEALATFWNREYFQGTPPPVVLRSSRAVRAYVASTPTAIGYIGRTELDASVAEVEVVHGD